MTVKELRAILKDFNQSDQVVCDHGLSYRDIIVVTECAERDKTVIIG